MTLEELVIEIQQGRSDYAELWERVKGFISLLAIRRFVYVTDPGAVDVDDLIQSGFIGLTEAVASFDAEGEYSFLSYLRNHLKRAFNTACGVAWTRTARDPIHNAVSLDAPIDEDDPDTTLLDLQPSPGDLAEEVEEKVFQEQLHGAIERLLSRLSKAGADVIRSSFFNGESMGEIAKRYSVSESKMHSRRTAYLMQLRALSRSTPEGVELRKYVEENTNYYMQVGRESFARTHTSAPEALTLRRDHLERAYLHNKWNGD